jgi:hypothetical protein
MFDRYQFLDKDTRDSLGCETLIEWKNWVKEKGVSLLHFVMEFHPDKLTEEQIFIRFRELNDWMFNYLQTKEGLANATRLVEKKPAPVETQSEPTEDEGGRGIGTINPNLAGLPHGLAKTLSQGLASGQIGQVLGVGAGGGTISVGAGGMQIGGNITPLSGGLVPAAPHQPNALTNPNEPNCVGCEHGYRECDRGPKAPSPVGWTFNYFDSTADPDVKARPDTGYTWFEINPPHCVGYLADHYTPCEYAMLRKLFQKAGVPMADAMESVYEVKDSEVQKLVTVFEGEGMTGGKEQPENSPDDSGDDQEEPEEHNCSGNCGGACSKPTDTATDEPTQIKTDRFCPQCGKKSVYDLGKTKQRLGNEMKCLFCSYRWFED